MRGSREQDDDGVPRVLIVLTSADRRGAEIEGAELTLRLNEAGFPATAVALSNSKSNHRTTLDSVEVLGRAPLAPLTLLRLRRRSHDFDVVVAYGSKALPACALALIGARVPFIYRSISDPSYWAGGHLRRTRTRLLLRRTVAVVALWPGAKLKLQNLYGISERRLAVIPNARDSSYFRRPTEREKETARRELGVSADNFVVAVVGALEPEKDVARAVRSALLVPSCHVVVAGDGSMRSSLEHQFRGQSVTWLGSVSDVRSVLWAADLLLSASRSEGLAGVIIEAHLCGLSVVATAVGAAGDFVFGEAVTLVASSSGDSEIAAAIVSTKEQSLVTNPMQEFEWASVLPLWQTIIRGETLCGESAGPSAKVLRVLYLIDSLAPGGAESSLAELAPRVVQRGVELHVAFLIDRPGFADRLAAGGAVLHPLGCHKGRIRQLIAFNKLIKAIEPDIVHTTLFESDQIGRISGWWAKVPVVSSLVNTSYDAAHYHDPNLNRLKLFLAFCLDSLTCRIVHRFHAISETVSDEMVKRLKLPRTAVSVVSRGRDLARFSRASPFRQAEVRRNLGFEDGDVLILAVARQDEQKGLDLAIRAMQLLQARLPSTRLILAGKAGAATPQIARLVTALGLEQHVTQLGHRDDIVDLMSVASVLVFPSRREGLGGVLIEAMSVGLPIVCSDLPVLREVASDGADTAAVFVEGRGAKEYADAMELVLTDHRLAESLGRVGRRIASSRHDIDGVASQMIEFWSTSAIANTFRR